jgi:hypothetical protein
MNGGHGSSWVVHDSIQLVPRFLTFGAAFVIATNIIPAAGMAVLAVTALHALRGTRQTVEALFVLAFAIMVNKTLVPVDVSLMRWAVLACAGTRVIWDTVVTDQPIPTAFWWLTALVTVMMVFAMVTSWLPTISLFKSISFFMGTGTAVLALHRTRHLSKYWQSCLLTFSVFVVLGSLPLYTVPSYGFARNGVGFQGLLAHPQTYGPISAILTAYVTGLVIFRQQRSWVLILTILAGWVGVYFSLSRTGLLAILLGGGITIPLGLKKREWYDRLPQLVQGPGLVLVILAVSTFFALYGPDLVEKGTEFLMKDNRPAETTVVGVFEAARGGTTERSMENFRNAPLTGIGLGVPSDLSQTRIEYGPFGVPIGASVEKGFTPTAVLEEIGLVGAGLLLLFVAVLLKPVFGSHGNVPLAWMVMVAVLINMGEAIIFAVGGNGLFFWLVVSIGYACTSYVDHRQPNRQRA